MSHAKKMLLSLLLLNAASFPSLVSADQCSEFGKSATSEVSRFMTATPQIRQVYQDLLNNEFAPGQTYASFDLFQALEQWKSLDSQLLAASDIASTLLYFAELSGEMSTPEVLRLSEDLNEGASPERMRESILAVFDVLKKNEQAASLLQGPSFGLFTLPPSFEALQAALRSTGPDGVIYQGIGLRVVQSQVMDGMDASLSPEGFVKLHQNRIVQDLQFLGYSCADAMNRMRLLPKESLRRPRLSASYGARSVTYGEGKKAVKFAYPDGYAFKPKLDYRAHKSLKLYKIKDSKTAYQGDYEITDFGYGNFSNYTMNLRGFYVMDAALNLIRRFPESPVTFNYNPNFFSKRGISDLPGYFLNQLKRYGLPTKLVNFVVDETLSDAGESFGYSWTRDMWLNGYDHKTKQFVTLTQYDFSPDNFIRVPVGTVGGEHYPIGKYVFLNKDSWQYPRVDGSMLSLEQLKEVYHRVVGREPIFIDQESPELVPSSGHIDTYMIFLPQPDGKPVIGVPDYEAGLNMVRSWSDSKVREVVRERFLSLQIALRVERDERVRIDSFDTSSSGMPTFLKLAGYTSEYSEFRNFDASVFTENLDREVASLTKAGFKVFRYLTIPRLTQANGFVEVTNRGASFTVNTNGIPDADASLAAQLASYGYSLKLIPTISGIDQGAGYHCLTNENRLTAKYSRQGN